MTGVIGVDLSITATGIADRTGNTFCVGGKAEHGDHRIHTITRHVHMVAWAGATRCDLVVIEDLAVHGPGNGMAAAQVMGAVKSSLIANDVPYLLVPPSSLKKYATGRGNATKADMAVALYKRAGIELGNDNEVDAWWLRALGLHMLGAPVVELPAVNLSALDKLTLPEEVDR